MMTATTTPEEETMIIAELTAVTTPRLATVAANANVRIAASALSQLGVGLLVVHDEGGPVRGVVSKSDLVRHLAGEGTALASIDRVMTPRTVTCTVRDDLRSVWTAMVERRLQNVPVLNRVGTPVGVLDIRDALQAMLKEGQEEERLLINYVAGIGYR